jgi:NADP-dependent 3-hydroxy acid dehydrogenase YdfG
MYLHAAQIRLQVVVNETTSGDRRVVAYPTDVAYEDDVVYAVTQAIETCGHIDIVVYAAGTDVPEPIAGLSTSDWDYVLDVNLRALSW